MASATSGAFIAHFARHVGFVALIAAGCAQDFVGPDEIAPLAPEREAAAPAPGPVDAGGGRPDVGAEAPPARPPAGMPGGRAQDPECDLGGRWLVAQRILATAVGQSQAAHNWFLYEIRHEGARVTVTRGLHCGFEVVKRSALAASVDSSATWPALLARNSSTGRGGTFVKEGAACRLSLDKEYVVRGATVPHYLDPARPMPGRGEAAMAGMPGWEDWDGDGNPGLSFRVSSSLASGTLYACQREWTRYDGLTPGRADKLRVAITYGVEQVALGRSAGSPQALETGSTASSDPAQHYAWFHRLGPGQATGSDAEACMAVRSLRNELLPEANQ